MYSIIINDKEYKVPKSWDDISYRKYKSLLQLDSTKPEWEYQLDFLSLLSDIPATLIMDVEGLFQDLTHATAWFMFPAIPTNLTHIDVQGKRYRLPQDFIFDLTIGQYSQLETMLSAFRKRPLEGLNYYAACIVSPSHISTYNEKQIADLIEVLDDAKAIDLLTIHNHILKNQAKIVSQFTYLFRPDKLNKEKKEEDDYVSEYTLLYSWRNLFMKLASDDYVKLEVINQKPAGEVLNHLNYLMAKKIYEPQDK